MTSVTLRHGKEEAKDTYLWSDKIKSTYNVEHLTVKAEVNRSIQGTNMVCKHADNYSKG